MHCVYIISLLPGSHFIYILVQCWPRFGPNLVRFWSKHQNKQNGWREPLGKVAPHRPFGALFWQIQDNPLFWVLFSGIDCHQIAPPFVAALVFPLFVFVLWSLDLRMSWLGKQDLFTGPFGWLSAVVVESD